MHIRFLIASVFITTFGLQLHAHPYYVSTTEIHIHRETKTFDITCSMFTEDLEFALKKLYVTNTDLQEGITMPEILNLVNTYVNERLEIRLDGSVQKFSLLGCENENESTWCYFEGSFSQFIKEVTVTNSLLFDFLNEQTNMVHVHVGAVRKSYKLANPNKLAEFSF